MRNYILTGILYIMAAATGAINIYAPVVAVPVAMLISILIRGRERIQLSDIAELKAAPGEPPVKGRLWLNGSWLMRCPGCASAEVNLPADLATIRKLSRTRGPFRFTKTLDADALPRKAKKYLFRGNGIAGTGKLFINGVRIDKVIPGYTPFEIDITDYVKAGDPHLKIEIETMLRNAKTGPGREMGLGPVFCSGVFREIWIDGAGDIEITGVWIENEGRGSGNALIMDLRGEAEFPVASAVEVTSLKDGAAVARFEKILPPFKGLSSVTFILPSNGVKPWRPSDPQLYEVKIRILSENSVYEKKAVTGLCRVDTAGGGLRINGKDATLKGVIRSEHYPPYGAATPGWAAKKDVAAIKEIHMNLAYCKDYPPHPKFMEECDRQGLFVAAEFPYKELKASLGADEAKKQLSNVLERLSTHPSFLWVTISGRVPSEDLPEGRLRERIVLENTTPEDALPGTFSFTSKFVDLYSPGHNERTISRAAGAGLVIVDFIDTEAGREPRNKREQRKASQDLSTIKAADRKGIKALVLGRFFTWGLASGIFSINRTKKASAVTIASHLQTGGEGEVSATFLPYQLSSRIFMIIASACLFLIAILPPWRNLYLTAPAGLPYIQPFWHCALIFFLSQICGSFGISIFFNMRRRTLTGAASYMGYSSFMNIYTSDYLRALAYATLNLWLIYSGTVAAHVLSGAEFMPLVSLVMTASMFDILIGFTMFSPVRPVVSMFCSSAVQGVFLSYFVGPVAAVAFTAIRFVPFSIILIVVERKNIFRM